jgi:tetratricopeptide (TPR) repeat protein
MFDADYRLKELSMGLAEPGIDSFRTGWDRDVEEIEIGRLPGRRKVSSRFWFYPINPHVVVREGVCVVRGLKVGVFTEVLTAEIDGRVVHDIKAFKNPTDDTFASDVSRRFDELCRTQPSFNRLRGLQELVAVSKALEELEERPDLSYWLEKYPLAESRTRKEVTVLRRRYDGNRGWLEVSGGVHLTALAMRLKAGDTQALREAVLKMRPSPEVLTWEFVAAKWLVSLEPGQVKPEEIAPLLQQASFLLEQGRESDALALCDQLLSVIPNLPEGLATKGRALWDLGRFEEALACFEQGLVVSPMDAILWYNKGASLSEL